MNILMNIRLYRIFTVMIEMLITHARFINVFS